MNVALIQMPVVADKATNLDTACQAITQAASHGIDIAVLPEMFCCPYANDQFWAYAESHRGMAQTRLSTLAAQLGIYIVGGSIPLSQGESLYNASFVYDRQGHELACHRKVHLFDIDVVGGQRFKESDTLCPGNEITLFETEFGTFGLCICFDIRFEELSRCMALQGALGIFCPAAFNMTTGPAHWDLVFRQRAVDNQCFTFAVSPSRGQSGYIAYGHSMAVDPWGRVLTQANEGMETLVVPIDLAQIPSIRSQLPILSARREDLYTCGAK